MTGLSRFLGTMLEKTLGSLPTLFGGLLLTSLFVRLAAIFPTTVLVLPPLGLLCRSPRIPGRAAVLAGLILTGAFLTVSALYSVGRSRTAEVLLLPTVERQIPPLSHGSRVLIKGMALYSAGCERLGPDGRTVEGWSYPLVSQTKARPAVWVLGPPECRKFPDGSTEYEGEVFSVEPQALLVCRPNALFWMPEVATGWFLLASILGFVTGVSSFMAARVPRTPLEDSELDATAPVPGDRLS